MGLSWGSGGRGEREKGKERKEKRERKREKGKKAGRRRGIRPAFWRIRGLIIRLG
ncbi:hypothetical protein [Eisenbergiella tayi]|uniref:hypothetical protein n=1 Tax=Eisenbergiella tayi TaxID=1432052 RepID=UPI0014024404|nr:hypothetical protein [Eisenbergiella tayi]MBS6816413.1 hypothetical protein [Lachnospiraceae bacterium]